MTQNPTFFFIMAACVALVQALMARRHTGKRLWLNRQSIVDPTWPGAGTTPSLTQTFEPTYRHQGFDATKSVAACADGLDRSISHRTGHSVLRAGLEFGAEEGSI